MFVGHLGAGLAVKAAEPRWNLGVLFAAALFADLLLWTLVLAGVESPGHTICQFNVHFIFKIVVLLHQRTLYKRVFDA